MQPDASTKIHAGAPHILALDGLRGVAILAVLAVHFGGGGKSSHAALRVFAHVCQFGGLGVALFFVLSGFLISGILLDSLGQQGALRSFYIRRGLRILPLYNATLLFTLVYGMVMHHTVATLSKLWVPALFLQTIGHLDRLTVQFPVPVRMIHYWSLAVEEHLYLLWPFLLMLAGNARKAARLCLAVATLSVAASLAAPHIAALALCDYPLLSSSAALALGGWLAASRRNGQFAKLQPALPWIACVTFVSFLPFAARTQRFNLVDPQASVAETFSVLAITICLAALIGMVLNPGLLQRLMTAAWLRSLGRVSFGLYLFHELFLYQFRTLARWTMHTQNPPPGVVSLIAITCSIALAYASYHFFERPFLRLKDRFAPRVSGASN